MGCASLSASPADSSRTNTLTYRERENDPKKQRAELVSKEELMAQLREKGYRALHSGEAGVHGS